MSGTDLHPLLQQLPHRRLNALTGEWVFVSPHRTQRPWQGRHEPSAPSERLQYDPQCYLCPGNVRANGERNPQYASTYVFTNDFPAMVPEVESRDFNAEPLLQAHSHRGMCRVICYSPRHDLTLAEMPASQIRQVIDTWAAQMLDLRKRWRWIQIFENKGAMMGCSNPHPHGQIWASDFVPNEPAKELAQQKRWLEDHGSPLLIEYANRESELQERIVVENPHWLAVVPWWAVWPYETLVLPRRPVQDLPDLTADERDALADFLSRLLHGYDRLFGVPFPYSFGWHCAPCSAGDSHSPENAWQLHAHFYPPLLRSATVRKFMVGYELFAEPQRDLTPENAAAFLRQCVATERAEG